MCFYYAFKLNEKCFTNKIYRYYYYLLHILLGQVTKQNDIDLSLLGLKEVACNVLFHKCRHAAVKF